MISDKINKDNIDLWSQIIYTFSWLDTEESRVSLKENLAEFSKSDFIKLCIHWETKIPQEALETKPREGVQQELRRLMMDKISTDPMVF